MNGLFHVMIFKLRCRNLTVFKSSSTWGLLYSSSVASLFELWLILLFAPNLMHLTINEALISLSISLDHRILWKPFRERPSSIQFHIVRIVTPYRHDVLQSQKNTARAEIISRAVSTTKSRVCSTINLFSVSDVSIDVLPIEVSGASYYW